MQGFMMCYYKFVSKCRTLNIKKKYFKISMKYKLFTHFNTILKNCSSAFTCNDAKTKFLIILFLCVKNDSKKYSETIQRICIF